MNTYIAAAVMFLFLVTHSMAQGKKEYHYPISYISASVVFIDAGREQHIAIGDTLRIVRADTMIGAVAVVAVSRRSSAAKILQQHHPFIVGDTAAIEKNIPAEEKPLSASGITDASAPKPPQPIQSTSTITTARARTENIVSGRFGVQYFAVIAEDARFNSSQPSALLRLDVGNVLGTGMTFSMYSRNYYDLSNSYYRYGDTTRLKNLMYECALERDQPDDAIGYGIGRMTSRFVGGLGTFDGGQFYVRQNNVTAGVIYGAKVGERTMELDGDDRKGALFVNYRYGPDFLHQYDGTVAYVRQLLEGRLDREFLYLQNSLSLSSALSMYASSEIELNDITKGVRTQAFSLSNTFLSVNYYPYQWFSANVGYDATRGVYLFETMKLLPDSLFDRNMLQGFRGGAYFRLPYFISLSFNGAYREKKGDVRSSHDMDATVRMSNIAGSEVNAGLRAANLVGVYTDGHSLTFDVDRTFFNSLAFSLRYDYYAYTISALKQSYTTQTMTANLNYRISRSLYSSVSLDRVIDVTMNSYRVYAEIGIRF